MYKELYPHRARILGDEALYETKCVSHVCRSILTCSSERNLPDIGSVFRQEYHRDKALGLPSKTDPEDPAASSDTSAAAIKKEPTA